MRSNKNDKKVAMNRRSEELRRPPREKPSRDRLEELRARSRAERDQDVPYRQPRRTASEKPSKKPKNKKLKRRNQIRNKIVMILYTILSIYIIFS